MDWLLAGPAAPFLGEDDDFEAGLAPPPTPPYYNGLCQTAPSQPLQLPTPTPSDKDPAHSFPPGFGPVPMMQDWEVEPTEEEQQWLTTAVKKEPTAPAMADETGAPIPDLNTAAGVQIEDVASSSMPPPPPAPATPPPPPSTPATPPPSTPPSTPARWLRGGSGVETVQGNHPSLPYPLQPACCVGAGLAKGHHGPSPSRLSHRPKKNRC